MEIIPLKYAESFLREDMVFINGDKEKYRKIIFMCYLIKTNNKLILVDAGCENMPGFLMENFIGPISALREKNILPDDITDVIITHSHHDHIECVRYYKNALIHIQKDEYESGKEYIPSDFKINTFDGEFLLCDDVKIIKIGGHTEGSCIVEVKHEGKYYIIVGDECYSRENLNKKIPTGSSYNKEKSKNFIEKYSDSKYTVLLCHDK